MVFKKMMKALGVGGPGVETVLDRADVRPGEVLAGQVHIIGGDHDVDIDYVALGLVTRAEVESGDQEYASTVEFARLNAHGAFHLAQGQRFSVPFRFQIPWETPLTLVYGQHLHGMTMGVHTELAVAKAVDKSDLDGFGVHPLPAQERVLRAFADLGFRFRRADVERGRIAGVRQELPFFQEIEFMPPPQLQGRINEVELTFVTDPRGMTVVLEADKRGGMFTAGTDAFGRFVVSHEEAVTMDWARGIDGWLRKIAQQRGFGY